jgi:hypothetical protein
MASPPLHDRVGLDPELRRRIEAAIADHGMLDRVIRWGLASEPRRVVAGVVVQDEYTHDIIVPWGDGLWLVYDCT